MNLSKEFFAELHQAVQTAEKVSNAYQEALTMFQANCNHKISPSSTHGHGFDDSFCEICGVSNPNSSTLS